MWLRAVFPLGALRPSFRGPVFRAPGPGLGCGQLLVPCGFSAGRAFMWAPAGLPGPALGPGKARGRSAASVINTLCLGAGWLEGKTRGCGDSRSKCLSRLRGERPSWACSNKTIWTFLPRIGPGRNAGKKSPLSRDRKQFLKLAFAPSFSPGLLSLIRSSIQLLLPDTVALFKYPWPPPNTLSPLRAEF